MVTPRRSSRVTRLTLGTALATALAFGAGAGHSAEKTAAPAAPIESWTLRLPKEDNVAYQGAASFDEAGLASAAMLYPAPNLGGFLAALITHGVLLEGSRSAQKRKIREDADKVLQPYQDVLRNFRHGELMQQGLARTATGGAKRLVPFSEKPGAELFVESEPLFSMTQDQSAIILDNAITIYAPHAPATPAYQNIVRVVSHAEKRDDLVAFWNANAGEALKGQSIGLFAESLDLALGDIAGGRERTKAAPHRTVRYLEGGVQRMERAQVIDESCKRLVLRNLRGWLMSVPPRRDAGEPCAEAEAK